MSGAFCPSCGVAVVPGYVRCPKCHKPLPRRPAAGVIGGTALESSRRLPLIAVVAAAFVVLAIIVYLGLRKTDQKLAPTTTQAAPQVDTVAPEPAAVVEQPDTTVVAPSGPDAGDVAADLERALKRQRLWSTVSVVGDRVDVRSGSCGDAAMAPLLDGAAPSFKAAGLTKLRCLEQSGRVVTARDL
jgi:hypothetical protein